MTNDIITVKDVAEPTSQPIDNSDAVAVVPTPESIAGPWDPTLELPTWLTNGCRVTFRLPCSNHFLKGFFQHKDNQFRILMGKTRKRAPTLSISKQDLLTMFSDNDLLQGHKHRVVNRTKPHPRAVTTSTYTPPPVPTFDKPFSNSPSRCSYNIEQLKRAFGFRNIDNFVSNLKETSKDTFSFSTLDREPILDLGEVATINKNRESNNSVPLPDLPFDTIHTDIVYGSQTALGGIRYALFIIDRKTWHKYCYPLKSLKSDLLTKIKLFCSQIGRRPRKFFTDFDHKLCGRKVLEFLQNDPNDPYVVETAPPSHQDKNGLSERNWQSILRMLRGWLASSLLPTNFWYYALKRATEVSNYVPIRIDNKLTTPYEMVYQEKPDLRNLFPMFSVGYVSELRDGSKDRLNMHSKTLRAIAVGRSDKSNCLLFYHPPTKQLLTSADFRLDENLAAGPAFGLTYDGGLYINKFLDNN